MHIFHHVLKVFVFAICTSLRTYWDLDITSYSSYSNNNQNSIINTHYCKSPVERG